MADNKTANDNVEDELAVSQSKDEDSGTGSDQAFSPVAVIDEDDDGDDCGGCSGCGDNVDEANGSSGDDDLDCVFQGQIKSACSIVISDESDEECSVVMEVKPSAKVRRKIRRMAPYESIEKTSLSLKNEKRHKRKSKDDKSGEQLAKKSHKKAVDAELMAGPELPPPMLAKRNRKRKADVKLEESKRVASVEKPPEQSLLEYAPEDGPAPVEKTAAEKRFQKEWNRRLYPNLLERIGDKSYEQRMDDFHDLLTRTPRAYDMPRLNPKKGGEMRSAGCCNNCHGRTCSDKLRPGTHRPGDFQAGRKPWKVYYTNVVGGVNPAEQT